MYFKNLSKGITLLLSFFLYIPGNILVVTMVLKADPPIRARLFIIITMIMGTFVIFFFTVLSKDYSILYRVRIDITGITLIYGRKIKQKYLWEDFINIERRSFYYNAYEFIFLLRSRKALRIEDRRKIRKAVIANCTNPKIVQFIANL